MARVEVPVVGDGAGIHPQLLRLFHERRDAVEAVEQAVVRVQVQVAEATDHCG